MPSPALTPRADGLSPFTPLSFPSLADTAEAREFDGARDRGFSAGYAAGSRAAERELLKRVAELDDQASTARAAAAASLERSLASLAEVTAALHNRVAPVIADAAHTLVDAAVALAESVIGRELDSDESSARSALARALDHPEAQAVVAVRMHPVDLRALSGIEAPGIRLVADRTLGRGDAIAELPVGFLDARIRAALDRARAELEGER